MSRSSKDFGIKPCKSMDLRKRRASGSRLPVIQCTIAVMLLILVSAVLAWAAVMPMLSIGHTRMLAPMVSPFRLQTKTGI